MSEVISQQITEAGLVVEADTLAASSTFTNTGQQMIYFKNSSGIEKTITITTQVTSIDSDIYGDTTKANATKVVANGEVLLIGPFSVAAYNDTDQLVTFAITPYDAGVPDSAAILYL